MDQLKLAALDAEDLQVVSAHVQDAVVKLADMHWQPAEQRFMLVVNRFVWDSVTGKRQRQYERRRSALHFNRVMAVRSSGIDRSNKDAVLELLALAFEESEAPAGQLTLVFAGGGAVQLDVECIEAQLADLGAAWATDNKPEHDLDEA
ncbi:DUF2948 family protein [Breoghania sp. L-A4]|uniref:DUF2948 family protein n=1 Tax=Breoghania sp. L-A4 TaxID=2304600 RepID=UPI000E35E775|nr:DUF2948 family protein [Breoghania sp. L-A4]AXS42475.1 DUF2948 family protein [Breoghania sp. L-A4]